MDPGETKWIKVDSVEDLTLEVLNVDGEESPTEAKKTVVARVGVARRTKVK